ncbi:hypothetical protein A0J51_03146 [Gluconobacter japonicus]|nr:hypothetical protein A0J51_03146 [Gluconobacter japonicus]
MLNNPIFPIDRPKQKGSMGWANSPACVVPSIAEDPSSLGKVMVPGKEGLRAGLERLRVTKCWMLCR